MKDAAAIPNMEQVYEDEASADVAEIYADIRETMSMSFVNLIWRRLALSPEGLAWTWRSMKPLYTSGVAYGEAEALRSGQNLPPVPRLPVSALRAVGIDQGAEEEIRAALAGYDRGNPLNTVAFSSILARLNHQTGEQPVQAETAPVVQVRQAGSQAAPRLMNFDEMDSNTTELVHAVTRIGARGEGLKVQVSLPRNLAHWPGFLSLYLTFLQPLHDDGRLFDYVDAVLKDGRWRGANLAPLLADASEPGEEASRFVRETLETLVPHAMGRMIPVVSLLINMLPE